MNIKSLRKNFFERGYQCHAGFQKVCQNGKFARFTAYKGVSQASRYPIREGNTSRFYGIQYGIPYAKTNFKALPDNGRAERMNICLIQTKQYCPCCKSGLKERGDTEII